MSALHRPLRYMPRWKMKQYNLSPLGNEIYCNAKIFHCSVVQHTWGRVAGGCRGFSRRPYWRAETMKQFCMKIDLNSQGRETVLFLPSNMAAMTSHENALL